MKKTVLFTALGLAAVAAHAQSIGADAQPYSTPRFQQTQPQYPYQPQPQYQQPQYQPAPSDSGRVISSTPVVQQLSLIHI